MLESGAEAPAKSARPREKRRIERRRKAGRGITSLEGGHHGTPGAARRRGRFSDPADEARVEEPAVHRRERPDDARREKRAVWDVAERFGNLPEVLLRGHPIDPVEAGDAEGARVASQRLFAAQVQVRLEVGEHEALDGGVDRLPEPQARVVGPRDRPPAAVLPEDRQHVIVVLHGLQVEDQGRMSLDAQGRGREERSVHALHPPLAQDPARRPAPFALHVVVQPVEEFLDPRGGLQVREERPLPRRQSEAGRAAPHGTSLYNPPTRGGMRMKGSGEGASRRRAMSARCPSGCRKSEAPEAAPADTEAAKQARARPPFGLIDTPKETRRWPRARREPAGRSTIRERRSRRDWTTARARRADRAAPSPGQRRVSHLSRLRQGGLHLHDAVVAAGPHLRRHDHRQGRRQDRPSRHVKSARRGMTPAPRRRGDEDRRRCSAGDDQNGRPGSGDLRQGRQGAAAAPSTRMPARA